MYLLNNCFVALVSGAPFGNPECVRISYAASDEKLIEAVKRISHKLNELGIKMEFKEEKIMKNLEKNKEISQDELHRYQEQVQKTTDNHINEIDNITVRKEKEIMEI